MHGTADARAFLHLVAAEIGQVEVSKPPLHNVYVAYAVLLEEVDELWEWLRRRKSERSPAGILEELVQIAATSVRAVMHLEAMACPVTLLCRVVALGETERPHLLSGHEGYGMLAAALDSFWRDARLEPRPPLHDSLLAICDIAARMAVDLGYLMLEERSSA